MSENIERLTALGGDPLSGSPVAGSLTGLPSLLRNRAEELLNLLIRRNGFYAFESALLVRPLDSEVPPVGIFQWNKDALWRSEYKADFGGVVFFAEDIFGVQFCIKGETVCSFDPETGELKDVAASLEEWSRWILHDSKTTTGWPFAHFWQLRNGALKSGDRLLPKVPFILGGQFAIENLYEINDAEGMRFRASIANQLRDCPDGSKVVLKIERDKS